MGLSIKFFSGWEICSSLMESSPKQSKEVFLSFLFFQSCQSICLQWFQEAASLLEAYIFTVYGLFSLPFHRKTSRSLRFLIWTSTSSVFVLSWKTKVFSSLFLFLSYSHATAARQTCSIRHWPFTCVPPPPSQNISFLFLISLRGNEKYSGATGGSAAVLCMDVKISEAVQVAGVGWGGWEVALIRCQNSRVSWRKIAHMHISPGL